MSLHPKPPVPPRLARDSAAQPPPRQWPERLPLRLGTLIFLISVAMVTAGCMGAPNGESDLAPTAPPALGTPAELLMRSQPLTVPVTVEVTRVVVTERIVPATPTPPEPCTKPALADASEVVVAAILPLSQVSSLAGSLGVQVALNLAANEINASGGIGGKPLRLIITDSGEGAERGALAAQRALSEQCAVALLTSHGSETAQSVIDVAAPHGVPVIVLEAGDDAITASRAPHLFRLAPANSMLTAMYGDWLGAVGDFNGDGARTTMLIIENTDSARIGAAMISDGLAAAGVSADVLEVDLPNEDFSSAIARIVVLDQAPDAIFIRFNDSSAAALMRQLDANGIGPDRRSLIVATRQALDSESFWQLVGESGAYTVIGRVGPWPSTVGERGAAFASSYSAWMQRWPESSAFLAYDSLYLLRDAILSAESLQPADLILALEASDLEGASGRIRFDVTGASPATGSGNEAALPDWAWHQWLDSPRLFLQYAQPDQPAADMAVIWPDEAATVAGPVLRPEQTSND